MYYDVKNDCWVTEAVLPARVKGLVTVSGEDTIVLINESLSDSAKRAALAHEYHHIKNGDLFSDSSVPAIENN